MGTEGGGDGGSPVVFDVVRSWDLFDRFGYYLSTVESPVPLRRSARMAFGPETVTGVVEDAVGAQFVVRLRLPK